MLLATTFLGVLTHVLFHILHPRSILVPLCLSTSLVLALPIFQPFGIAWHAHDFVLDLSAYVASLVASVVIYRLSPFHPLAQYPGPVLARTTKLWGFWNAWSGKQHHVFLRLHREYGPFIRTGPNEISVVDVTAVTDVFGAGGVPKGEFYLARQDPNVPNNLLIMTGDEHDNRRRLWNRGMSHESLKEYEEPLFARGNQLVDRLKQESHGGSTAVDIVRWTEYFTFDFMGDMAFGGGFNMLLEGEDERGMWDLLSRFAHITTALAHVPWAIRTVLKAPFISRDLMAFRKAGVELATARIKGGAKVKDLWYHLADEAELEKTRPSSRNVVADGALAMVAGADTTSSALAAFWYFMLMNPDCYERLREEVDKAYPPGSDPMETSRHDQLVWLEACLNETLRLAPPLPTNGPRQVPHTARGATVAGRFVPPGTQIYIAPWVLHRDPRYFSPSADKFMPSRWLPTLTANREPEGVSSEPTFEGATLDPNAFIPFSYGPANCVGRQLARIEMRTVISALVQRFEFAFAGDADQEEWLNRLQDYGVMYRIPLWVKITDRMA